MGRLLRRILICMVLGGLATVGVAWWFAITTVVRAPQRSLAHGLVLVEGGYNQDGGRVWWCQVIERTGLTVVVWNPLPTRRSTDAK